MEPLDAQNNSSMANVSKIFCAHGKYCLQCKYLSPIKLVPLKKWLDRYPNRVSADMLLKGFTAGFRLEYKGVRAAREAPNLKSVKIDPNAIVKKLEKEISLGRIAGPFNNRPLERLIISPVGLVPKAEPGKLRLIQHLSYPEGSSVNDGIDREYCKVQYAHFDVAVNLVARLGPKALMAKTDIQSAFRLLPVHPEDFELLGICVEKQYFVDKALPMGASCSPAVFEKFSTFLEWAAKTVSGSDMITHFADDFFVSGIAGDSSQSCSKVLECFNKLCKELGVPLAEEKSVGPTSRLVYLGLEIDAVRQIVAVPEEKMSKISEKIQRALQASEMSLREIQSLIGSLSFICRAVAPGRPFLRRLIDLTCGVKKQWHKIKLSSGAKADMKMWAVFLSEFNGVSIIPEQMWVGNEDLELFTDASGSQGFGGYFGGRWFQGRWPGDIGTTRSIAWMEFFPVAVAVVLWCHLLQGKRILIRSDNVAVVSILNKQTSKCPVIMRLLRFVVLQCLKYNTVISARHLPGESNEVADSLSRLQVGRFRKLAPHAARNGTPVPEFMWKI